MSPRPANTDSNGELSTSDTFLSRVFGLHSVYNSLPENYQYYDPESQIYNINPGELQGHRAGAILPGSLRSALDINGPEGNEQGWQADFLRAPDKNLLDSESGLDLSSSDSLLPPSPLLRATDYSGNPQKNQMTDASLFPDSGGQTGSSAVHNHAQDIPTRQGGLESQAGLGRSRMEIPPRERALYLWANIVNMDEFLMDVYYYYRGKGFSSIVLARVVDISILVFVLSFTTFLRWGIDYDFFFNGWSSNSDTNLTLADLVIANFLMDRVPFSVKVFLLGFFGYTALRMLQLYFDYRYKLSQLLNFYKHLLGISDDLELMTISWSTIVQRLMQLKDQNSLTSTNANIPPQFLNDLNSKVRLNAHDIANRIMRKENYMIALVNKDVLDLSIPCPSFLRSVFSSKSVLTRTLEWNIKLCINNFVFSENGQINQDILKESSRNALAQELSSRFKMAAIINLILCPFIVTYFVLLYFFRYFNEYKSNPSSLLGLRQYTPWAEWKLREFNELSHLFIKRLHLSIGPANTYINQFPGGVFMVNLLRLLNFVSSAFLAVLVIFGLLFDDEEHNFWSFEITQNRSTLFYISVFGTLWAVTSSSANTSTVTNTAENLNTQGVSFFYDPEASLRYVSQFTHYLPSSWNGKLHTVEVKNKFCELFSLKIVIIINEILSLILTPFILWFKILNNSSAIIDFFREYTIHVDGLGYVCYFAMFNFEEKDKNMMFELKKKRSGKKPKGMPAARPKQKSKRSDSDDSGEDSTDSELQDYYQDDKMIKSYMYFLESYGNKASNGKRQAPETMPKHVTVDPEAPLPSVVLSRRAGLGNTGPGRDDGVHESSYNFSDTLEASIKPGRKGRKGVLGMINQFSKQEVGR
ncbi:APG9-domain-containing protein [Metschnikowia bicuspidata var. bicuspidata NRRL YB-4993]|uniref:Autophagy-related protein 9 n=1 Tax=Metschnikowia bicuspidata var. bicuspidata NRRL YB-4993 TaxID=869754 RepID=A0A1A0HK34_9ASCO|nr:APG9-domain-containing protein [Metschnikowia bicuspidata var. bicuspidata NRRL YB-4993]OBA24247.1 APG9-domain-containing protein [Metschnikowia bicuspidata var. bicuspidata NRRL YB-4993]